MSYLCAFFPTRMGPSDCRRLLLAGWWSFFYGPQHRKPSQKPVVTSEPFFVLAWAQGVEGTDDRTLGLRGTTTVTISTTDQGGILLSMGFFVS